MRLVRLLWGFGDGSTEASTPPPPDLAKKAQRIGGPIQAKQLPYDLDLGPKPQGESLHCALLLDHVPPKEPLGTPLGNTLRITRPKVDWRGP